MMMIQDLDGPYGQRWRLPLGCEMIRCWFLVFPLSSFITGGKSFCVVALALVFPGLFPIRACFSIISFHHFFTGRDMYALFISIRLVFLYDMNELIAWVVIFFGIHFSFLFSISIVLVG